MSAGPGYTVRGIPPERRPVLDRLAGAARRFQVHALVELDVAEAQRRMATAPGHVSWTGFVTASVATAAALHPEVNARKAGRRVLYFDRVDVGATVERVEQGRPTLDIVVLREADRLSCVEVTAALHRAKVGPPQPHPTSRLLGPVLRLPGPVRRAAVRAAATSPAVSATFGPAVGVTSIGMFSSTWGWAVPLAPLTVIVTVGGVAERAVARDGQVVVRPMLPLTISLDHAVVDGAPAARFVETLRRLVETAATLDPAHPSGAPASAR